jgi:hypothetical protein
VNIERKNLLNHSFLHRWVSIFLPQSLQTPSGFYHARVAGFAHSQTAIISAVLLLIGLLLVGCGEDNPVTPVATQAQQTAQTEANLLPTATAVPTVVPTNTPIPTPTPIPLAATVNGEAILLTDYEAKLAQYQQWFPNGAPDGRDIRVYTLETMITQRLVEQAAAREGVFISADAIQQSINEAIEMSGGQEAYQVWLEQSNFTEATFYEQTSEEAIMQAMVEHVTANVPTAAEFVRARYIQVDDPAVAETVIVELAAGADFVTLVQLYSVEPTKDVTNGDLGFFSRNTLLVPEVEAAAFDLQPFEHSGIITVNQLDGTQTYYVVETVARDAARPLTPQQRFELLQPAFENWLALERANATIEVSIGFD